MSAAEWETTPVACNAPALTSDGKTINLLEQDNFREDDEGFSNQGGSGLCARHAVSKSLLQTWRKKFGRKHPMDLKSIIAFLVTAVPKGSKSAKVTDFDGLKGQILDPSA